MGNRMGTVVEEYKDEYPSMPVYAQCQSNAFVSGMVALVLAGTATYAAQEIFAKSLPWSRKAFIFPSVLLASIISYKVARRKTADCQEMWIAMEERRTYLTRREADGSDNVKDIDRKLVLDATWDPRLHGDESPR